MSNCIECGKPVDPETAWVSTGNGSPSYMCQKCINRLHDESLGIKPEQNMSKLEELGKYLTEIRSLLPNYEWEYIDKALALLAEAEEKHREIIEGMSIAAGELLNKSDTQLTTLRQQVEEFLLKTYCNISPGMESHIYSYIVKPAFEALRKAVGMITFDRFAGSDGERGSS